MWSPSSYADTRSALLTRRTTGDNNIRIFKEDEGCSADAPSFSVVASIPNAHSEDVNCIVWSPTEAILASGSDDGVVALWEVTE